MSHILLKEKKSSDCRDFTDFFPQAQNVAARKFGFREKKKSFGEFRGVPVPLLALSFNVNTLGEKTVRNKETITKQKTVSGNPQFEF